MTPAEIVLDASALVRGLQRASEDATEIIEGIAEGAVRAHAANALLQLHRAGRSTPEAAVAMLEAAAASALVRHPSAQLNRPAFEFAVATGLSAYDAFYAVLSEVLEMPLVTADRKLAAAVERSVLVT